MKKVVMAVWKDICENRIALFLVLCYIIVTQAIFKTVCPMKILTGFPCPGCGLTHGGICVLIGQWKRAWEYHPLIFFWMLVIIWWFCRRYIFKTDTDKKLFYLFTVLCCLLTVLRYLYQIVPTIIGGAV